MNWTYSDQESRMLLSYFTHLSGRFITNNPMKVEITVVVVGGAGEGGIGGGEVVLGIFSFCSGDTRFYDNKKGNT
jgi:hypothetical protein